jgi:hypothetical protein
VISTRATSSAPIDQADVARPDRSRSFIRWSALAGVAGGALWAVWTALEATRSGDQSPTLAIGALVLIGIGMVGLDRLLAVRGDTGGRLAVIFGVLGIGLLVTRYAFDVWQLFVGLLGVLAACVLLGLRALKTKAIPGWASISLIAGSALVIVGNSEGSGPWLWVPFGVGWMAAGLGVWFAAAEPTVATPTRPEVAVPFEPAALDAEGASFRPVITLARVEGRRLITHPIFLASPLVSVVMVGGFSAPPLITIAVLLLTGLGFFTVAEGTLLVANLAASRSRRHATEELYATLPVSARSRTTAGLLSLGWPAAVGLGVNLLAGVYLATRGTLPANGDFGPTPDPFSFVLLQGPALLILFGAAGIFLARWIPTATVGPLAVVGMFMVEIPFIWSHAALKWFAPLALLAPFDSELPKEAADPSGLMGWHVLYLLGLSIVLGALASLRHGRSRGAALSLVGGVLLAGLAGVLQVVVAA